MRINRVPVATYRLQMNAQFRFADATRIVPYLAKLGITDLYSSPILTARAGSTHGYDLIDPDTLNPEVGSESDFAAMSSALRQHDLGFILDIVPNHMAASSSNRWWFDVLELGGDSEFAEFFDVNWQPFTAFGALRNRVLIPILGKPYGEILEGGELKLTFADGAFTVEYYENRFPVTPRSYAYIIERLLEGSAHDGEGAWTKKLQALVPQWESLETSEDVRAAAAQLKRDLAALHGSEPEFRNALGSTLERLNGRSGDAHSFDCLDQLLEQQFYRLSYWRIASEEINYRRFFDVTDLIGVRIENPEVFDRRHRKLLEMIREETVTGLRVDHIDGLFDPVSDLRRMQQRIASTRGTDDEHFFVVVEKILAEHEEMPESFQADGTTGYDFLNMANGVLVDGEQLARLQEIYDAFTGAPTKYEELAYRSKKEVVDWLFAGEVRALSAELAQLAQDDRNARDFAPNEILQALIEVTAALDRYRTYIRDTHVSPSDRDALRQAIDLAVERNGGRLDPRLFEFLHRVFTVDPPYYAAERRGDWLRFVMRWQQFTGRAMAKGIEDTAFYRYHRLLSMNEVGGEPVVAAGVDLVDRFHRFNERMAAHWPLTVNTTSTHDTKRSEDVRARIDVLSEVPDLWERSLRSWGRINYKMKVQVGDRMAPDRNEEHMLYQTLLGVWPLDSAEEATLPERLTLFVQKALREAKTNTSWLNPDEAYENAVAEWVKAVISDGNIEFRREFDDVRDRIAHYGFLNSLAQVVLKIGAAGVADFYQGQELWDFSLVDPDNRRPVDYALRERLLQEVESADPVSLLDSWRDGRVKLFTTATGLRARNAHREAFTSSSYRRLSASGEADRHICAFARGEGEAAVLVVAPRLLASLVQPGELPLGSLWNDATLELVSDFTTRWRNVFTREIIDVVEAGAGERRLPLDRVFATFPVAILERAD